MSYIKQNFVSGQTLTAEHMNHIEDGIVAVSEEMDNNGFKVATDVIFVGDSVTVDTVEGEKVDVAVIFSAKQEGEGNPSMTNIRHITGMSSITVNQAYDGGNQQYVIDLDGNAYGGSVDFATGKVTITHKLYELAIADMNNDYDDYPGWKNVTGFHECFASGKDLYNATYDPIAINAGTIFTVNYNYGIISLNKEYYNGRKQSEWKQQFPDFVFQILMPLITPKTIDVSAVSITSYNGENTFTCADGEMTITTHAYRYIRGASGAFDPYAWGLPVLMLNGDCTGMTKDDYVSLSYSFEDKDGNPLIGYVDVKKQGSSSINTGIEIGSKFDADLGGLFNFTLKFPEAFEAAEGWGAQTKYCFKANAIDHTHARNVCSCKLWGQIVKDRDDVPTELSSLPNGGAIDGFPIIIVLNDRFYAIGTFNIPKDGWMFGTPKAILCADAHVAATQFKELATLNGDFELEYAEDKNDTAWILPSINAAIQAVMDSDGSDLDTVVGQYIDIPSAIDYMIHNVDEDGNDATDKNYILVTFDGVKWYFSVYDRDTTYGLMWNGKSFTSPIGNITYAGFAGIHALMNLIYTHRRTELKARAVELHNGIRSEANVATVFTNFVARIPSALFEENAKRWPLLRSTSAADTAQILNWYRLRRAYLDKIIDGWTD